MKIGILTQPLLNNYGGILQNYALQQVLIRMGHDVETIDWRPYQVKKFKYWLWRKKQLLLHFLAYNVEKPRYQLNNIEQSIVSKHTDRFVKKYISVCPILASTPSKMRKVAKIQKYDVYVVGSDQVWRPGYNTSMPLAMFLDFCEGEDVKRIAYAASFGTSNWEYPPSLTKECARLAHFFDQITVREESGVRLCQDYLGVSAINVLDPTMLLEKKDYVNLVFNEKEPPSKGGLFYYILDPSEEKNKIIEEIALSQQLTPFTVMPRCQAEVRSRKDVKRNIEDCVFPTVTSWLRGFMDAKMIIVDSFHGVAFSIIFNRPFWVIGNAKRGNARFESILKMFKLEDRMFLPSTSDMIKWNHPIDWVHVNGIMERERERCIDIIRKNVHK